MEFNPSTQRGIALIIVLTIGVAFSLVLGVTSKLLNNGLSSSLEAKEFYENKIKVHSKAAELKYLLATQRRTAAGVSYNSLMQGKSEELLPFSSLEGDELRVDGKIYYDGDLYYSIQSEDGLIPINNKGHYWLHKLLSRLELSEFEVNKISDGIRDFADEDDWQQPAGAEAELYSSEGIDLPSNYLFQTCTELRKVLAVRNLSEDLKKILIRFCALGRSPQLNVNAVPKALWEILWPELVDTIFENRDSGKWFMNSADLVGVVPQFNNVPEDWYKLASSNVFLLTIGEGSVQLKYRVVVGNGKAPPLTVYEIPTF